MELEALKQEENVRHARMHMAVRCLQNIAFTIGETREEDAIWGADGVGHLD